jgi:hypothetical protein
VTQVLLRALADLAVFLATSDDQTVHRDSAVRELEALATHLQDLEPDDMRAVANFLGETLSLEAELAGDDERAAVLRDLPSDLGLTP